MAPRLLGSVRRPAQELYAARAAGTDTAHLGSWADLSSHYVANCRQSNAFLYFTKLAQMKVWERFRVEKRLEDGLSPHGGKK